MEKVELMGPHTLSEQRGRWRSRQIDVSAGTTIPSPYLRTVAEV